MYVFWNGTILKVFWYLSFKSRNTFWLFKVYILIHCHKYLCGHSNDYKHPVHHILMLKCKSPKLKYLRKAHGSSIKVVSEPLWHYSLTLTPQQPTYKVSDTLTYSYLEKKSLRICVFSDETVTFPWTHDDFSNFDQICGQYRGCQTWYLQITSPYCKY